MSLMFKCKGSMWGYTEILSSTNMFMSGYTMGIDFAKKKKTAKQSNLKDRKQNLSTRFGCSFSSGKLCIAVWPLKGRWVQESTTAILIAAAIYKYGISSKLFF